MIKFSTIYQPTALFSLKDSNSTNSAAKSLFLPSPYTIKMAILNQAITCGGELKFFEEPNSEKFEFIKECKIDYHLAEGSNFCVTNSFVKILKPKRNGEGFMQTVTFREYVFLSHPLEIIFEVNSENAKSFLKKYLYRINYFGKRGCFFQFLKYSDSPNPSNVVSLNDNLLIEGIFQNYDDFTNETEFKNANTYSSNSAKRISEIKLLPVKRMSSSKSFSHYKLLRKLNL